MTEQVKIKDTDTGLLIHADMIDDTAREQIEQVRTHPAFKDLIAIMPDVHAGAGCVIGFTGRFRDTLIPNIVGVDIGCGVLAYPIGKHKIDFEAFDAHVRGRVPLGFKSHDAPPLCFVNDPSALQTAAELSYHIEEEFFKHYGVKMSTPPLRQLGTLGGGNHFIEIDQAPDGEQYIVIHSGSRNFGLKVATHFQKMAKTITNEMGIMVPKDLEYLPMSAGGEEYMKWLHIAQRYAQLNRYTMLAEILDFFGELYDREKSIESVHNYISERDHIIRKGAISAHSDQTVIIPLNMAEGVIIGQGKSNKNYNYSAPHGAGRAFGRKEMGRRLERGEVTMDDFTQSMEGIFSTSISAKTIDESKFAYKPTDSVMKHIAETVDITMRLKPIYNSKAE